MTNNFKTDFKSYLNKIRIATGPLTERAIKIFGYCKDMCPEELEDIFVEEYINEEGVREYTSLSFFSKNYCISASDFKTKEKITIGTLKNFAVVEIQTQDYNFKKATKKSRLKISARSKEMVILELKASQENCDFLREIFFKYIKSNLLA